MKFLSWAAKILIVSTLLHPARAMSTQQMYLIPSNCPYLTDFQARIGEEYLQRKELYGPISDSALQLISKASISEIENFLKCFSKALDVEPSDDDIRKGIVRSMVVDVHFANLKVLGSDIGDIFLYYRVIVELKKDNSFEVSVIYLGI